METDAGKEGYVIGRCHQGGIDDGYFAPLNVIDRVAIDTARRPSVRLLQTLGASLNSVLSLSFSGSLSVFAACFVEMVSSQKNEL